MSRSVKNICLGGRCCKRPSVCFASYGADEQSADASRVLRVLGSVNPKATEERRVVRVVGGTGRFSRFEDLFSALQPYGESGTGGAKRRRKSSAAKPASNDVSQESAEGRNEGRNKTVDVSHDKPALIRGSTQALKDFSAAREGKVRYKKKSPASLGWARFCDLRDLFLMRGGIPIGMRDLAMFWMLNSLAHAGVVRLDSWERDISDLLVAFPRAGIDFDPLADGSMMTLKDRLEKTQWLRLLLRDGKKSGDDMVLTDDLLYRPSNEYLIDIFR